MSDPLQTGFTRVFLIEGRARADRQPSYESTMKMAGVEQGFGDVTSIYSPHPRKYDSFEIIGTVRGEAERPDRPIRDQPPEPTSEAGEDRVLERCPAPHGKLHRSLGLQ